MWTVDCPRSVCHKCLVTRRDALQLLWSWRGPWQRVPMCLIIVIFMAAMWTVDCSRSVCHKCLVTRRVTRHILWSRHDPWQWVPMCLIIVVFIAAMWTVDWSRSVCQKILFTWRDALHFLCSWPWGFGAQLFWLHQIFQTPFVFWAALEFPFYFACALFLTLKIFLLRF